jgi:hypothetical protein
MDSYIVRIYRRAGKKPRILIGTVEPAWTRRKMAFTNIEELWEILRRPKDRSHCVPTSLRRRLRKEVMSGKAETGREKSMEGVRKT